MSNAMDRCDALMRDFAENHMEKLFYFCLKKTGNQVEAEDLTQDIALQVLTALHKGTDPSNFLAWIWQIARNRYALWAKEKHRRAESVTGSDISDYEISDDSDSILDEMIHNDDLSLLRRELAFISSDYRNIVVAYYIQNISMRDIAVHLSLSLGTVKKRLQRARNILKEGMNMAREFGTRSYNPEEISFVNNCSSFGDHGQPWSILSHAMYKNIFLEAYGNPSTAEELSLALGVALPYMEDELEYLTNQTFLLKEGNKYQTSFPIVSRTAQEKIHYHNVEVVGKLTSLLEKLIDRFTAGCASRKIAYYGEYQAYEDAKWTLLMKAFDVLMADVAHQVKLPHTQRPDHGCWDIVGFQNADISTAQFVGLHGVFNHNIGDPTTDFCQYKFKYQQIDQQTPDFLNYNEAHTLELIAKGNTESCDEKYIQALLDYGYITPSEDGYKPTVVVFKGHSTDDYWQAFSQNEKDAISSIVKEIRDILSNVRVFAWQVTSNDLPSIFRNDELTCRLACGCSQMDRGDILQSALTDGWLRYDENTGRTIGAHIYI